MSKDNYSFKVLVCSHDESIISQIVEKVKGNFEVAPIEVDACFTGNQALLQFNQRFHDVIITFDDLPGLSGSELIREVRKEHGGVSIILLSQEELEIGESGVEFFQYPVTDWARFLSLLENIFPDELKAKYGLGKKETLLVQKLKAYSEEFLVKNEIAKQIEAYRSEAPLMTIPVFSDSESLDSATLPDIPGEEEEGRSISKKFNIETLVEYSVLLLLVGATVYLFRFAELEYESEVYNVKNFVALVTAVSFLGHFASRILGHKMLKDSKKS